MSGKASPADFSISGLCKRGRRKPSDFFSGQLTTLVGGKAIKSYLQLHIGNSFILRIMAIGVQFGPVSDFNFQLAEPSDNGSIKASKRIIESGHFFLLLVLSSWYVYILPLYILFSKKTTFHKK